MKLRARPSHFIHSLSLKPTATATDICPVNSLIMDSRHFALSAVNFQVVEVVSEAGYDRSDLRKGIANKLVP